MADIEDSQSKHSFLDMATLAAFSGLLANPNIIDKLPNESILLIIAQRAVRAAEVLNNYKTE